MAYKFNLFEQQNRVTTPQFKAVIALVIALLAYSVAPILIRLAEQEVSSTGVIFDRFFLATLFLGGLKILQTLSNQRQPKAPQPKSPQQHTKPTIGFLVGSGVCFAGTQVLWAVSLTQTSVANSSLLHSLSPLFTTVGGWLIFSQIFDRQFTTGMLITIVGASILGFDDLIYDPGKIQGDLTALMSALLFAFYFLFVEHIREKFGTITTTFYCCTIGTITVLPFLLQNSQIFLPRSVNGWVVVTALAVMLLLIYTLTTYAIKWLSSSLITIVLLIEPAISALLAWFIFSEALDLWNILSFPIVLLGIFIASQSKTAIKKEQNT